jgi:dihydroorotase
MMVAIHGRLLYRGEIIEAGIEIENGIIKEIKKTIEGEKIQGLILPAGIDVHVHLRDLDESEKETIESGSLSALYGGNCLVVDQPNSKPFIDDYETYKRKMEVAKKKSYIDYRLNLGLTAKNAKKINEIIKKIEVDYKIPAIGEIFIQHEDPELQISYETLSDARMRTSKLMSVHAEDPSLVDDGRPPEAEIEAVKKCLELGNFHFCHISTHDSAILISDSNSTFEVTPHHFLLSSEIDYGEFARVNPPLRNRIDAEMLFNVLQLADILASDHAPHTLEDKKSGAPGFPGVETTYPIVVNLMRRGLIGIRTVTNLIAINPAKIFGFERYGEIEVGNYANFAVFNLKAVSKIKAERLHTKAEWTPFENFEAVFPDRVYLKGELALIGGEVQIEPGMLGELESEQEELGGDAVC